MEVEADHARLVIPQEQLEGLLPSLGFSRADITKMLGVSERTIRRRRETFDMPSTGQAFSQIDDDEIDRKIFKKIKLSKKFWSCKKGFAKDSDTLC